MEEDAAIDWRKWAFLIACASLLWNLINSIITYKLNKNNKRRAVGLDEFRTTVRDPVRLALDGLTPIIAKVQTAVKIAPDKAALRDALAPINKEVVSQLGQISDALADANESKFADGEDWLDGFAEAEDDILALFDKALNPSRTDEEMKNAIGFIPIRLRKLRSAITSKLDDQVKRLS